MQLNPNEQPAKTDDTDREQRSEQLSDDELANVVGGLLLGSDGTHN